MPDVTKPAARSAEIVCAGVLAILIVIGEILHPGRPSRDRLSCLPPDHVPGTSRLLLRHRAMLTPGTRLGPYEIVSSLGAGGMGEVYRARDTELKREVAIKILPADVTADADRLARFQREAEILASLNHQNIAHVFGMASGDPATESGRAPVRGI